MIGGLLRDPPYAWIDVGPELVHEAVAQWLERYADQRFLLTDAVSLEVMRRERLNTVFAYDRDFETAGF